MNIRLFVRAFASCIFALSFFFPWFRYEKLCLDARMAEICNKPIAVSPFRAVFEEGGVKYDPSYEMLPLISALFFAFALFVFISALRGKDAGKEKNSVILLSVYGVLFWFVSFMMRDPRLPIAIGSWMGLFSSLLMLATLFRRKTKQP